MNFIMIEIYIVKVIIIFYLQCKWNFIYNLMSNYIKKHNEFYNNLNSHCKSNKLQCKILINLLNLAINRLILNK
jgi:hypothetical protein